MTPNKSARPQRGEIWVVEWSPGRGSEQTGKRPAVIVQNDFGNRSIGYTNTIVVAVSTQGLDLPIHVRVRKSPGNGLKQDSFVKCEQVLTIDKHRLLGRVWGKLNEEDMARVDLALKRSLGLT